MMGFRETKICSLSTTEAELVVACSAAKELMWLTKCLEELQMCLNGIFFPKAENQDAIRLFKNPEFHRRSD